MPAAHHPHWPPCRSAAPTQSKRSRGFRCTRTGQRLANAEAAAAGAQRYRAGTAPSPRSTQARSIGAAVARCALCAAGRRGRSILLDFDTALVFPEQVMDIIRSTWRRPLLIIYLD